MISQTAAYALRAVVYLITQDGSPITRREIAGETQISIDYLARMMQALSKAGIISAHRGPGGGYILAKDKQQLTAYDVVAAVDPISRVKRCPLGLEEHARLCPLHAKLDEAAELVENSFRSTLVIDLLPNATDEDHCEFPSKS